MKRVRPWAILALLVVPAVWHVVDFENDIDPEFPKVERPTFSKMPPASYRLAEPGDTIDHLALYAAGVGMVLSMLSRIAIGDDKKTAQLWDAAFAVSAVAFWQSCAPGPWPDGTKGLGWRNLIDPGAPARLRLSLLIAATVLGVLFARGTAVLARNLHDLMRKAKAANVLGLLLFAVVLVAARQFEVPGVEPVGYWPKWAFFWGLSAFDLALIPCAPRIESRAFRYAGVAAAIVSLIGLHLCGREILRFQRPIARLKEVVPGKIYISAMPNARGLALAYARHRFKTIVNLFPEDMPGLRSSHYAEEVQFAREHGIHYVRSPLGASTADAFLSQTLQLAQNPDAWPILVHCHACMDRTPAWLGIYRFVVEGRRLDEVMREIEQHRGYRPKGSVTLLFNRVLPARASERFAGDPTARLLKECARGTIDPYYEDFRRETAERANSPSAPRVGVRDDDSKRTRRP